jgi:hypothetical protein
MSTNSRRGKDIRIWDRNPNLKRNSFDTSPFPRRPPDPPSGSSSRISGLLVRSSRSAVVSSVRGPTLLCRCGRAHDRASDRHGDPKPSPVEGFLAAARGLVTSPVKPHLFEPKPVDRCHLWLPHSSFPGGMFLRGVVPRPCRPFSPRGVCFGCLGRPWCYD